MTDTLIHGWTRTSKPNVRWTKIVAGGIIYLEFKENLFEHKTISGHKYHRVVAERWLRVFQPTKGELVEIDFIEVSSKDEIESKMIELEHLHDRAY